MKTCPKCKMTSDAHSECPLCRTDITGVPYNESKTEKYAFNKYLLVYVLKFAKFFLFCLLACVTVFIIKLPDVSWLYLISLFCLAVCFCETFYPVKFNSLWKTVYSEDYLEITKKLTKYESGILAILLMLIPRGSL